MTKESSAKKQLIIFFLIAYGVNFLFGIPMNLTGYIDSSTFALFMMILPATGVAFASLTKPKAEDENRVVHYIYIGYFLYSLLLLLLRLTKIIHKDTVRTMFLIPYLFLSIILFLYTWRKETSELYPFKNGKSARKWICFFILFQVMLSTLSLVICHANLFSYIISFPVIVGFFVEGIFFLGEEYGWRGFLQEKIQARFGKRTGIILLGIIWELWHMPLWFSLYVSSWSEVGMRFLSTVSLAIFFGYVYMKTKNIWTCAFLHFFFNFDSSTIEILLEHVNLSPAQDYALTAIGILSVLGFASFIFAREYRKDEDYG